MDIILYKKTMDFISALYHDRGNITRISKKPTKNIAPTCDPIRFPFLRATPEDVGISSEYLLSFLTELSAIPSLHAHSLMIAKDDKIILDCAFYPYRQEIWHVSHSLCKSITAIAVGLMIEDGLLSLDDKLFDIFEKRTLRPDLVRQREITIRHLLTMSAGVTFNEAGSVTYEDWVEGFFSCGVKFTPGTQFFYNSMNSYMLSAAIKERSGRDMFEILQERIFSPMGITEVFWEKCPKGITKGGWGLYMKIEDLMKFGKLFLDGGLWMGQRLINEAWLAEATAKQIDSNPIMSDFGYGYHIWQGARSGSYQFNGMLGQNLILLPDIRMVIATYCGNAEFFPKSQYTSLIDKYFGNGFSPTHALRPNRKAASALKASVSALSRLPSLTASRRKKSIASFLPILNKHYVFDAKGISLLPLAVSVLHDNFAKGIRKISFRLVGESIEAIFDGESGRTVVPFFADGSASYFTLSENGESYAVSAIGKMAINEDDIPVFKLSLYYLEVTSVRHIKIFFHTEKITVQFTESPDGIELLNGFRPMIEEYTDKNKAAKLILSKTDADFVEYKLNKLFSPTFLAKEIANEEEGIS